MCRSIIMISRLGRVGVTANRDFPRRFTPVTSIMSDLERIVKAAQTALHVATNEQGEKEVHGRAVRYELKGYFYKWELNFKAEVVDVATGVCGEAKHFVNKDTALDNAIEDLFSKLKQKGLLEAPTTSAGNTESDTVASAGVPEAQPPMLASTVSNTTPPIAASTGRQQSSTEITLDSTPSLVHLLSLPVRGGRTVNLPQQIGTNYTTFGILLLNDHTGAIVDGIAHRHLQNTVQINMDILKMWIGGGGRKPVSWRTLITTLGDCGLDTIANAIQKTFE